jgi:hypothetical protein
VEYLRNDPGNRFGRSCTDLFTVLFFQPHQSGNEYNSSGIRI